jgi:DNA invertase Pin-like site-specific DNA recombinase
MSDKWGYARTSSDKGQSTEAQVDRLRAAGCKHVFTESVSGKNRDDRPQLANAMGVLGPDDCLCVVRLDRLGRNTRDVLNISHEIHETGAFLEILEPAIDTKGDIGRIVVTVFGMVAEMERNFIMERQRAGIERIKADPKLRAKKYPGRQPDTAMHEEIIRLKGEGKSAKQVAGKLGVSIRHVFHVLALKRKDATSSKQTHSDHA